MGLDVVEFIMQVEEDFDIIIDDGDAEELLTVGQLVNYILGKKYPKNPKQYKEEVFQKIKLMILQFSNVEPSSVNLESRFVQDLGFD